MAYAQPTKPEVFTLIRRFFRPVRRGRTPVYKIAGAIHKIVGIRRHHRRHPS